MSLDPPPCFVSAPWIRTLFGAKFGIAIDGIAEAISSLHRTAFILLTCVLLNGEFRLKSTSLSTA